MTWKWLDSDLYKSDQPFDTYLVSKVDENVDDLRVNRGSHCSLTWRHASSDLDNDTDRAYVSETNLLSILRVPVILSPGLSKFTVRIYYRLAADQLEGIPSATFYAHLLGNGAGKADTPTYRQSGGSGTAFEYTWIEFDLDVNAGRITAPTSDILSIEFQTDVLSTLISGDDIDATDSNPRRVALSASTFYADNEEDFRSATLLDYTTGVGQGYEDAYVDHLYAVSSDKMIFWPRSLAFPDEIDALDSWDVGKYESSYLQFRGFEIQEVYESDPIADQRLKSEQEVRGSTTFDLAFDAREIIERPELICIGHTQSWDYTGSATWTTEGYNQGSPFVVNTAQETVLKESCWVSIEEPTIRANALLLGYFWNGSSFSGFDKSAQELLEEAGGVGLVTYTVEAYQYISGSKTSIGSATGDWRLDFYPCESSGTHHALFCEYVSRWYDTSDWNDLIIQEGLLHLTSLQSDPETGLGRGGEDTPFLQLKSAEFDLSSSFDPDRPIQLEMTIQIASKTSGGVEYPFDYGGKYTQTQARSRSKVSLAGFSAYAVRRD